MGDNTGPRLVAEKSMVNMVLSGSYDKGRSHFGKHQRKRLVFALKLSILVTWVPNLRELTKYSEIILLLERGVSDLKMQVRLKVQVIFQATFIPVHCQISTCSLEHDLHFLAQQGTSVKLGKSAQKCLVHPRDFSSAISPCYTSLVL